MNSTHSLSNLAQTRRHFQRIAGAEVSSLQSVASSSPSETCLTEAQQLLHSSVEEVSRGTHTMATSTSLRAVFALAAIAVVVSASPLTLRTSRASEDSPAAPETSSLPTESFSSEESSSPETTAAHKETTTPVAPGDEMIFVTPAAVSPLIEEEQPDDLSDVPQSVSKDTEGPEVYSLHVRSDVKFRYSTSVVTSKVVNRASKAAEVVFQFVLPEKAFISGFLMEVKGKVYKAYVKEKEEANKEYQAAIEQGHTAAQVAVSARDSNLFSVSVNLEPRSKMTFNLTYEELLSRRLGFYDHIIHLVTSDKVIHDMKVEVAITEPQNITTIKVPEPVEGNEVGDTVTGLVTVTRPTPNSALITYAPTMEQQKKLLDKKKTENSLPQNIAEESTTQRLRVQYDVDHHSASGDVLLRDGYFVHFFAPEENSVELSKKLHKHVIFVLDTSGSMWGRKIQQLQEAMALILDSLNDKGDYFSIVQFSDSVKEWSPLNRESENSVGIHLVTSQNIEKAKKYIKTMEAHGGTNIASALRLSLQIAARGLSGEPFRRTLEEQKDGAPLPQPLVIFLTDGEPTTGETRLSKILAGTRAMNTEARAPIFSLAFGNDADFRFVRKLSLQNHAFARRIYEAADATLQLESFFQEVSSPLLNNVTFSYVNPKVVQSSLTESTFHTYFAGTEVVVAGRVDDKSISKDDLGTVVSSSSSSASMSISSESVQPETPVDPITTAAPLPPLEPLPLSGDNQPEKPIAEAPTSEVVEVKPAHSLEGDILHPKFPKFPPPRTPEEEIRKPEPGSLERLWAFLTIRQLLDKDLANEEEKDPWEPTTQPPPIENITVNNNLAFIGGLIVKEPVIQTPKQKALQLALQYGFVTPLTSLVVVKPPEKGVDSTKPHSSTVTDPMVEGKEKGPGYGQIIQNKIVPVAVHLSTTPHFASFGFGGAPGAPSFGSPVLGSPAYGSPYRPPPSAGFGGAGFGAPGVALSADSGMDFLDAHEEHDAHVFESAIITKPDEEKHLTISDIEWYPEYLGEGQKLNITTPGNNSTTLYEVDNRTWKENDTFGDCLTPMNQQGFCRHLSTCVQADFTDSYDRFISYFCPIENMVGVCCPVSYSPPKDMAIAVPEAMVDVIPAGIPDSSVQLPSTNNSTVEETA